MPDKRKQLGDQEIDVLRYIGQHAPITLRGVVDGYGTPKNLARTTILTVMDRLRQKGFLERSKQTDPLEAGLTRRQGVFVYKPTQKSESVMSDAVRSFVDKTLGGSLIPFVEYLIDSKGLTEDEAKRLRSLIDE